jgi:hypothetical protein
VRFGYADPPYFGCAVRLYGDHPDAAIYDTVEGHAQLFARLESEFPDGWAYSLTSTTLGVLLPNAPADVRVAAWVKPFAVFKPNVNPAYAWEPVLFRGGRKRTRDQDTIRDWVAAPITLRRGLAGAKPEAFCFWLFDLLGMDESDELVDLFPGTGAVSAAWESWRRQRRFA